MSPWPFVAAAIAGLVSAVELLTARTKPPPKTAVPWALLRISFDGLVSGLAYPLVASLGEETIEPPLAALIAGLAGPALLRLSVGIDKGLEGTKQLGLEKTYRRVVGSIDSRIDQLGARAESEWVSNRVLPAIGRLSLDDIATRADLFFENLDGITENDRSETRAFIQATVADAEASENARKKAMIYGVLARGRKGRELARSLVSAAEQKVVAGATGEGGDG